MSTTDIWTLNFHALNLQRNKKMSTVYMKMSTKCQLKYLVRQTEIQ